MPFTYLAYFSIAFLISSVLTPIVRKLAQGLSAVDAPDERKIHTQALPRLGGVAIAVSFLACLILITGLESASSPLLQPLQQDDPVSVLHNHPFGSRFFVAALVIFLLGAWDDWKGTNAPVKFFWQVVAALVVLDGHERFGVLAGFGLTGFPWFYLDLAVGVWWISYVCNAFNLIDGLDGLAAGTAFFSAAGLTALALASGNQALALLLVLLGGAVLGFLQYNRYPARIFMGDSGSLFIGFCFAVFSLRLVNVYAPFGFVAGAPLVALGLPLADTTLAILRRWLRSSGVLDPDRPTRLLPSGALFQPDREHIHHRMLAVCGHQRKAVNLLYLLDLFLFVVTALLAAFRPYLDTAAVLAVYGLCGLVLYGLLLRLGYGEILTRPGAAAARPPASGSEPTP